MSIPFRNINNSTFSVLADMNTEIVSEFEQSEKTTIDYYDVYRTIKYIVNEIYDEEY